MSLVFLRTSFFQVYRSSQFFHELGETEAEVMRNWGKHLCKSIKVSSIARKWDLDARIQNYKAPFFDIPNYFTSLCFQGWVLQVV